MRAGTCSYLSGCLLHHAMLDCFFFSLQKSPKLTQAHIYTFLHTCTYTHYIYVNPDGAASFILFSVIIAIHCYSHYHLLTYTLILPHMTPPHPSHPHHHRQECASLRAELSQRYSNDSHTALAELANLKDGAMKEAHGRWEEERRRLMAKVCVCVCVRE